MSESANALAIFDLDGTLLDSSGDIHLAVNMVLGNHGLTTVDHSEIEPLIGLPAAKLFEGRVADEPEAYVDEFRQILGEVSGQHSQVLPGVLSILEHLRGLGWKIAVATNKPTVLAETVLRKAHLLPFLDVVVGADGHRPKPAPDTLLECMRKCPSNLTWMIGDTTMDVLAGKAACVHTLAVATGSHSWEILEKTEPDLLYPDFREIANDLGLLYGE